METLALTPRVTLYEKDQTKGLATVIVNGQLALNGIRIIEGVAGNFISLPSFKKQDEYKELYHPRTREFREQLSATVLQQFEQVKAGSENVKAEQGEMLEMECRVTPYQQDNLRGLATVVVNRQLVLTNIRVMEGTKGLFVLYPNHKTKTGEYVSEFNPVTKECKEQLDQTIIGAYQKMLEKDKEQDRSEEQEQKDVKSEEKAQEEEQKEVKREKKSKKTTKSR